MKHLGENYETLAKLMNLLAVVLTVISCALIIIGACTEVFYTSEFNSGETYAEEGFYDYLDIVKSTDFTSLSSVNLFSYIMLVSAVVILLLIMACSVLNAVSCIVAAVKNRNAADMGLKLATVSLILIYVLKLIVTLSVHDRFLTDTNGFYIMFFAAIGLFISLLIIKVVMTLLLGSAEYRKKYIISYISNILTVIFSVIILGAVNMGMYYTTIDGTLYEYGINHRVYMFFYKSEISSEYYLYNTLITVAALLIFILAVINLIISYNALKKIRFNMTPVYVLSGIIAAILIAVITTYTCMDLKYNSSVGYIYGSVSNMLIVQITATSIFVLAQIALLVWNFHNNKMIKNLKTDNNNL